MPCLYSLKTMYRRLPFIILLSILAVFALRASVVAPSILVQNYSEPIYQGQIFIKPYKIVFHNS